MQRRRRLTLILSVAAIAAALAAPQVASACAGAGANPAETSVRKAERATLCLLNGARERHDLPPLRSNSKLTEAARGHSRAMVRHRFFSHTGADGSSSRQRIRRTGYLRGSRSWYVGENIAWGAGNRAKPRHRVRSWMKSAGHRANILRREFRHVGVGIARGAPTGHRGGAATYTTDFGRR